MACNCFFFGPTQISAIRKKLPHHLHKSSTFEVLTACLWRCRTIAIQLDLEDEVRLIFAINVRNKFNLPIGYYGNGIAVSLALTTAGKLCQNPLEYVLELIKSAKNNVTEYVRSLIDLLVIKGRPFLTMVHSYFVSDITRMCFSGGIPNRHNICLFAACFRSYSGSLSDRCSRPFNCANTFLVQNFFFPLSLI